LGGRILRYTRWAARKGFTVVPVERSACGEGQGIRSAEVEVQGRHAFGWLGGEKGTHRVVRVSPFSSLGKRHTAFAGVEATPILRGTEFALLDEVSATGCC
jgi:peptide chain release factor 2